MDAMDELDALVQRILKLYENVEIDEEEEWKVMDISKDGNLTDTGSGGSGSQPVGNPYAGNKSPAQHTDPPQTSTDTQNGTTPSDSSSQASGDTWWDKFKRGRGQTMFNANKWKK